jgi:hypothetical protein
VARSEEARGRVGHAEILRMLREESKTQDVEILEYLREIAASYSPDEAFSVMALVDTPDVFE